MTKKIANSVVVVILLLAFLQSPAAYSASQSLKEKEVSAVAADRPGAPKPAVITDKQREAEQRQDNAADPAQPQPADAKAAQTKLPTATDSITDDMLPEEGDTTSVFAQGNTEGGLHQALKKKFIEGNAGFMSLVALALVLGLAFCIERIIFLTLSEINVKRFLGDLKEAIAGGDIDKARQLCDSTRGPVAALCRHALERVAEPIDVIERGITSYGTMLAANLEKGCSWITLFIAMAPSLGFLGTVIGMVMAFDQIQMAGDISPTIVASGMKVALITTIFGIIVALVLQVFYNYILTRIESITAQMEEAAIGVLDSLSEYKQKQ